jgi:hypothetical protein
MAMSKGGTIVIALAAVLAWTGVAAGDAFLLIPDSTADTVDKYDPSDGTYIGRFCAVPQIYGTSSTPVSAVLGPDGLVYVSDQLQDAVFRFDLDGNFLDVFADDSDGLNNIRGLDFRGNNLLVCSGDDYVAEFTGPHQRIADFINDGSDPFDILMLPDGRALLADIAGTTDNVRLYDANGALDQVLFNINFPEQLQFDAVAPGDYLNIAFSGDQITDFDLDGTVHTQTFFNGGRGVYRLGNGNLLCTAGDGVWEVNQATGALIENKNPAASGRFIELLPDQQAWCLGDADCSGGAPDFNDVQYFIAALSGEAAWVDYHKNNGQMFDPPPCPYLVSDFNGGGVEFTDIPAFVQSLGQPCVPF